MRRRVAAAIAGGALLVGLGAAPSDASLRSRECGNNRLNRLEAVGLTEDGGLVCYAVGRASRTRNLADVSGLDTDTALVGMDYRPANGVLYALGDAGGVYSLVPATGVATLVSRLTEPLDGTSFGVDFNPVVDRLRIVSDTGQNLRVDVTTGATTVDGALTYPANPTATPPTPATTALGVAGAGYTNNDADANTGTSLFDIDTTFDQVVAQAPANAGLLSATGKLTVDAGAAVGFDLYSGIRGGTTVINRPYATLRVGGDVGSYAVDVLTGRATLLGTFDAGQEPVAIALPLEQR